MRLERLAPFLLALDEETETEEEAGSDIEHVEEGEAEVPPAPPIAATVSDNFRAGFVAQTGNGRDFHANAGAKRAA